MNKNILSLILIFLILVALLGTSIALISENSSKENSNAPEQLNLRQSFENEGYTNAGKVQNNNCNSQTPDCGYCPGIIIEGYCYIK
jgi:flagellar basal body-associated protein FliL